ncbi:MAG: ATP-grasp domain-containing protein [Coriobacteriia bacterium]|nr:ATP-grasp domain-containing protein [Coriobacteriia bacterium]
MHIQESALDSTVVLRIAKEYKAELVISVSMDSANIVACEVGEKLGLPVPYSSEAAQCSTNKDLMKEIMLAYDIPTSRYVVAHNCECLVDLPLLYPVVIKPVDRTGGIGINIAHSSEELPIYLNKALQESWMHRALIEEFVEGNQISVDCFVQNGRIETLFIRDIRVNAKHDSAYHGLNFGSISPSRVSGEVTKAVRKIAERIVDAFQLRSTVFLIQAIVSNKTVSVIELALRIGGGSGAEILKSAIGFDPIDAMVDSFLHLPVKQKVRESEGCFLSRVLYAREGVFKCIEGCSELLERGVIDSFHAAKTEGALIGSEENTRHRVGYFIIKADTLKQALEKEQHVLSRIEAYDDMNEPMLLRDVFIDKAW